MSGFVAPRLSELGGGIQKDDVGRQTGRYVDYFAEDASKDGSTLTQKRLSNYTDVVNSCARPAPSGGEGRTPLTEEGFWPPFGKPSPSAHAEPFHRVTQTMTWPPAFTSTAGKDPP
jgi:hypothetical protein